MDKKAILEMTADIVSAHASANPMDKETLLTNIHNVFVKLSNLAGDTSTFYVDASSESSAIAAKPAVPLEAAFGKEKIFCMVCGKGMKTLKRHLNTEHGLKPGQYRKQFAIPAGTKLVAADYAEKRRAISKDMDLVARLEKARVARTLKRNAAKAPKAAKAKKLIATTTAKRGRPKKAAK